MTVTVLEARVRSWFKAKLWAKKRYETKNDQAFAADFVLAAMPTELVTIAKMAELTGIPYWAARQALTLLRQQGRVCMVHNRIYRKRTV